ncbi:MAG: ELM1/GtrOC1 family putative glycosyltransferase [Sphingomonas sp.]
MPAIKGADVWVLLGPHRGDNNQLLALAESLGIPFRPIHMRYRWFAHLPAVCRSVTISQLLPEARSEIAPPWPSLVLGIGQRSAPVARYIKQASGGRTTVVRLGDPMVSPKLFDLVITTTQYAVGEAENVVRLPVTITNEPIVPDKAEEHWLEAFARPRRLIVIGGATSLWRLRPSTIARTIRTLQQRVERDGGSVIAVTSPRTSPGLAAAAQAELGSLALVDDNFPRYAALLSAADEIHVTGDSVSMLSDAIASGKPVGLIPLEPDLTARFLRLLETIRGRPFRMRDLTKFWDDLRLRGLVGTIENPRRGMFEIDPLETALCAVRAAIDERHPAKVVPARIRSGRRAPPQPAAG